MLIKQPLFYKNAFNYYSLGQYEKAIEYQQQRLAIAQQIGDRPGEMKALGNLGNAYQSAGKYDEAIVVLENCLKIAHEIGFLQVEGYALGGLGRTYWALHQREKVLDYHQRHFVIAQTIQDHLGQEQALKNMCDCNAANRNYSKAIHYGEEFESFPKLLDQLWDVRINSETEAQQLIAFLTQLAERMTKEEVLWLPSSITDENPEVCRTLEQAGIFITSQENSTLGFCHQTFYDHTLARAFARGSKSLADFVLKHQDGLFIRPILLRSLNYLRDTAPQQYQPVVRKTSGASGLLFSPSDGSS